MAARQKASFMPLIKKPLEPPVFPGLLSVAKFRRLADRPVDRTTRLSIGFSSPAHQSSAEPMHDHARNVR
ncbi:hypothetical protein P3T18_002511 [Paraburkholderia sp. GAS199]|uniref:hypothetical protein n=1 Tax=Paraburkholderia sp. GAS199 TaxID=3035126 RepID=UPI003D21AC04